MHGVLGLSLVGGHREISLSERVLETRLEIELHAGDAAVAERGVGVALVEVAGDLMEGIERASNFTPDCHPVFKYRMELWYFGN